MVKFTGNDREGLAFGLRQKHADVERCEHTDGTEGHEAVLAQSILQKRQTVSTGKEITMFFFFQLLMFTLLKYFFERRTLHNTLLPIVLLFLLDYKTMICDAASNSTGTMKEQELTGTHV